MKTDAQNFKEKRKSFKRFSQSFKFAYEGMRYSFYNEQNLIIMVILGIVALALGILLKVTYTERLVIILLIGLVLALEMVNTAIEAAVNLASKGSITPQAKVAKDCASGSVAIACIFSFIVGVMIFLPRIIALF